MSNEQVSIFSEACPKLTPAINNPNDTPSSPRFLYEKLVSAGLQRLPGLSNVEKPSIKMTATMSRVERIPMIDAYDNQDRGMNMVGTMLCARKEKYMRGIFAIRLKS